MSPVAALADEGGGSFWVPGQYGSFAAAQTDPGWSIQLQNYVSQGRVASGTLSAARNGVRVNGREIDESRLYEGDELAIGPILFRLEALDDNPETIGAPPSRRAPSPQPAARAIPAPPSIRPAAAGPARSSRPDSDIDLVPLDED